MFLSNQMKKVIGFVLFVHTGGARMFLSNQMKKVIGFVLFVPREENKLNHRKYHRCLISLIP